MSARAAHAVWRRDRSVPAVSVILPTYQRRDLGVGAVRSVLADLRVRPPALTHTKRARGRQRTAGTTPHVRRSPASPPPAVPVACAATRPLPRCRRGTDQASRHGGGERQDTELRTSGHHADSVLTKGRVTTRAANPVLTEPREQRWPQGGPAPSERMVKPSVPVAWAAGATPPPAPGGEWGVGPGRGVAGYPVDLSHATARLREDADRAGQAL
jgi:hypothetical protein